MVGLVLACLGLEWYQSVPQISYQVGILFHWIWYLVRTRSRDVVIVYKTKLLRHSHRRQGQGQRHQEGNESNNRLCAHSSACLLDSTLGLGAYTFLIYNPGPKRVGEGCIRNVNEQFQSLESGPQYCPLIIGPHPREDNQVLPLTSGAHKGQLWKESSSCT